MYSKRRSRSEPEPIRALSVVQVVLTEQNAEPQLAASELDARKAQSIINSCGTSGGR
jgi:hypothetical protein